MIFSELATKGAYLIDLEPKEDHRGFYARGWCEKEFAENGLVISIKQSNVSYTEKKGTLRGLHYQTAPYGETKLVRCIRGRVFDVIVDMREDSETYRKWVGVELSADNRRTLFVPEGFAHGFVTLSDDSELIYSISEFYHPEVEKGVRYNDPAIGIEWPTEIVIASDKDKNLPLL